MKINFKQPKLIIPLLALPIIVLCFYLYRINRSAQKDKGTTPKSVINATVGEVSQDVKKKSISDKLDASRDAYKHASGSTAINPIADDQSLAPELAFDQKTNFILDSLNRRVAKRRPSLKGLERPDGWTNDLSIQRQLGERVINQQPGPVPAPSTTDASEHKQKDPMDIFRQQMAYIDSIGKTSDPQYKAEKKKQQALAEARSLQEASQPFAVSKESAGSKGPFNTILPAAKNNFISCMIDENETVYSGSRIRLRLLEDIRAAGKTISKGAYLYALVGGFSSQRVQANVNSILIEGQVLPVRLAVYDLDGMSGLYVPDSQFRDFSKELGNNTIQGVSIDGNSSGSQFLMSTVDKVFQSTSSAIASAIRKNKAKLKYNSLIYLTDPQAQESAQKKD